MNAASQLPSGCVTFLFTDMEGSTRLWETQFAAMQSALPRHDAALRAAIEGHRGHVVKTTGDGFHAVFVDPLDGLAATLDAQRALPTVSEAPQVQIRARMALHTGRVDVTDGDYYGPVVNRSARLMAAAHGGQILVSRDTAQALRDRLPPDVALRDLGERRLPGLLQNEHVYQVVAAGLQSDFPPLRTLDLRVDNLPARLTSFVGRKREIASLRDRLRGTRLVTVTGPGGTGKTRLALEVATDVIDEFEDGVVLIELASVRDPGLVVPAIARALDVRETDQRALVDVVTEHLKQREVLLVLDNFEQVVDASTQVASLLAASPRVRALVTSREALHVYGEAEFPLQPLPTPNLQGARDKDALLQCESVALFAARAAAVKPDFEVLSTNAEAVAGICRALDGLPLAIELAAARIRALTPDAILRALDRRLRFLRNGARDVPDRQRTLHDAIDWSHALLNEAERALFRRLAVMAGGATLDAIQSVCAVDEASDVVATVESLVSKSLLVPIQADAESRFEMLETIREFAQERLDGSPDMALIHERHRQYFVDLAARAEVPLRGADQAQWLSRLDRERENLRAAFDWSITSADFDVAQRLCALLKTFWFQRGHFSLGRVWCDRALAPHSARTRTYADALDTQGVLAFYQSDYASARAIHEECLALRRRLDDEQGIAKSLLNLGNVAHYQGDLPAARARFEERLALDRRTANRIRLTTSLANLANIATAQGSRQEGQTLFEEALAIAREDGDIYGIAVALVGLGQLRRDERDFEGAESLLAESLAQWRMLESPGGIAAALLDLGGVALDCGEFDLASARFSEGLVLVRDLGDRLLIATALEGLADCAAMRGQELRASTLWSAAAGLREVIGSPLLADENVAMQSRIASARSAAGEQAFGQAWLDGRKLAVADAVALALSDPKGDAR